MRYPRSAKFVAILLALVLTERITETGSVTGRWVVATAYCSCSACCGPHAVGLFASGRRAYWGGIAADWRLFPPGTAVEIEGWDGHFLVEDKGRDIRGPRVDIWMHTHRRALEFGRQKLWVTVKRL